MGFLDRHFEKFLLIPGLLIVAFVALYPMANVFYTSFFNYAPLEGLFSFVGIENYVFFLTNSEFWYYFWHTILYTVGTFIIIFILALGGAWALNSVSHGKLLFLLIVLFPFMVPEASSAIMARWAFHSLYGFMNHFFELVGFVNAPVPWFTKPIPAFLIVILSDAWSNMPLAFLIIFAGFQRVPKQLEEATWMDGANKLKTLRYLYIPIIRPELFMVTIMFIMFSFRHFTFVFLITAEGPGTSTGILATLIQKTAMRYLQYGKAATLSVIMFIMTLVFVLFSFWWRSTKDW